MYLNLHVGVVLTVPVGPSSGGTVNFTSDYRTKSP